MSPLFITTFTRLLGVAGTNEIAVILVFVLIIGLIIAALAGKRSSGSVQTPASPAGQVSSNHTVVVVNEGKSVGLAFLLAFFFGPIGLLYASVSGGIVMIFLSIFVGIATFGLGLAATWLISIIWAVAAAGNSKKSSTTVVSSNLSNSASPHLPLPPIPSLSNEKESLLNQLTQLHTLREKGVLEQEVYEHQRKILVAKLGIL